MNNNGITKRLSRDSTYTRPKETYQDKLSNMEIKEKLKDYKKVENIKGVSISTHLRYFSIDPKTKEKVFRLGGNLNKIDPEGRYVILSNGTISWSVQIANTIFFQKMSESEFKEELKKELKKEIMTEHHTSEDETAELKKQIKILTKKVDQIKDIENENKELKSQLKSIASEIKKEKGKK